VSRSWLCSQTARLPEALDRQCTGSPAANCSRFEDEDAARQGHGRDVTPFEGDNPERIAAAGSGRPNG
jgi:hypothetical protein